MAQRLANPSAFHTLAGSGRHSNTASSKVPFLHGWQNGSGQTHGVTSHIVSSVARGKGRHDDDLEVGVRVDREVEHREERLSGGS